MSDYLYAKKLKWFSNHSNLMTQVNLFISPLTD